MKKAFQLELFKFKQHQPAESFKEPKFSPNFFDFIKMHEKAISLAIVLLITSVISFSLGVEKGKRASLKQSQPETGEMLLAAGSQEKAAPLEEKAAAPASKAASAQEKDISKYTIQVATFKTKAYAQKEATRLEKKGLKALIVPRGRFVCVYVGNFSEKQQAKAYLDKLKKIYQDCFIRRL